MRHRPCRWIAALLLGAAAPPAIAHEPASVPATAPANRAPDAVAPIRKDAPRNILFIGNSFTQGARSAARNWGADTVTDLNGAGYGGVPALFKAFADQVGLDYAVSLETQGGKSLKFHYDERRNLFDRSWDVVVLQEYSTLDPERPGDSTAYLRDVARLSSWLRKRNANVQIELMATWTRADQTYDAKGHWYGRPVSAMATDLREAADRAAAQTPGISGVLPVGEAWNRAMAADVADPNPYDGVAAERVDLWAYDHYHASIAGSYLEALVVFGRITGIDPTTLGPAERAADELGLSPLTAVALQKVARDELAGCAEAVCPVTGETAAGSGGHRLDADTPIEEIADDPSARAALARIIPRLFNHPSYEQFKSLSLRQLQPLSGGMIGPDDLERAEMALRAAKGG